MSSYKIGQLNVKDVLTHSDKADLKVGDMWRDAIHNNIYLVVDIVDGYIYTVSVSGDSLISPWGSSNGS